jgi:hypothetical protein
MLHTSAGFLPGECSVTANEHTIFGPVLAVDAEFQRGKRRDFNTRTFTGSSR